MFNTLLSLTIDSVLLDAVAAAAAAAIVSIKFIQLTKHSQPNHILSACDSHAFTFTMHKIHLSILKSDFSFGYFSGLFSCSSFLLLLFAALFIFDLSTCVPSGSSIVSYFMNSAYMAECSAVASWLCQFNLNPFIHFHWIAQDLVGPTDRVKVSLLLLLLLLLMLNLCRWFEIVTQGTAHMTDVHVYTRFHLPYDDVFPPLR